MGEGADATDGVGYGHHIEEDWSKDVYEASYHSYKQYREAMKDRVNRLIERHNANKIMGELGYEKIPVIKKVLAVLHDQRTLHNDGITQEVTMYCSFGEYSPRFICVFIGQKALEYRDQFECRFGLMMDSAHEDAVESVGEELSTYSYMWQGKIWEYDLGNDVYHLAEPERGENEST